MKLPCKDPYFIRACEYKVYLFNKNPIFLVTKLDKQSNRKNFFTRSWEESYSAMGKVNFNDVNPKYLAALISSTRDANISPYLNIKRIERSSILSLKENNTYHIKTYNPFDQKIKIKESENFYSWVRSSITNKIRDSMNTYSNPNIGIEHTSGLDSNVILSSIKNDNKIEPEKIYTSSDEGNGEKLIIESVRNEKKLLKKNCGNYHNQKIKNKIKEDFLHLNKEKLVHIYGAVPQIGGDIISTSFFKDNDCEICFSGLGGDQGFSHSGENIISDLVLNGRFYDLYKWLDCKKSIFRISASRVYHTIFRSLFRKKIIERAYKLKNTFLINNLTEYGKNLLMPFINYNYPWELDKYVRLNYSIKKKNFS